MLEDGMIMTPNYIPGFVDRDIAGQEFDRLWTNLAWERRSDAPRREYWQNDYDLPYTYGRGAGVRTYEARPWDAMAKLWMERLNKEHGFALDCCFMNGYEDARDWLGWHADVGTDPSQPVISLSLGGERDIEVRNNETGVTERFRLAHGSVFIMPPGFQQTHQHRIPKAGYEVAPRISLTYRGLIQPEGISK